MEHPSSRVLARYALGQITDDRELSELEDHLLACDACRRRAFAVDLIGTVPPEAPEGVLLHISATQDGASKALCGEDATRNVISEILLPGLDPALVCVRCLALLRCGEKQQYLN
jgi:hypothetical protein